MATEMESDLDLPLAQHLVIDLERLMALQLESRKELHLACRLETALDHVIALLDMSLAPELVRSLDLLLG